jgi:hypothetical protein
MHYMPYAPSKDQLLHCTPLLLVLEGGWQIMAQHHHTTPGLPAVGRGNQCSNSNQHLRNSSRISTTQH